MTKHYETVFILTPVLSEEQAKEAVSKYKKILADAGAKVTHQENWGLRKLAYPIRKRTSGFYHLFQIEGPGTCIDPFELEFRRDERVLRYLTVALDKYALEYADKRRERLKKIKEQPKEKEKKKEETTA